MPEPKPAEGPFDLRATIDELEKHPPASRAHELRRITPLLRARWSELESANDREFVLRAIADDLFHLGAVEIAETNHLAIDVARDLAICALCVFDPAAVIDRRATRLAEAYRNVLQAPGLLGGAQRALEEARCALLVRTPRDAYEPVSADGDPILLRFGALLLRTRESALGMCEALHLLAQAPSRESIFFDERAYAACAAALHSARLALRTTLLGALELSSATLSTRENTLVAWVSDVLRWSSEHTGYANAECAVARDFLRFAR